MVSARTEESTRTATAIQAAQVLYHDIYFRLWKVDENGRNPQLLESDYCEVNAVDPGGANMILTVCKDASYQQIYNRQGSGSRIPLAADGYRS